MTDPRIDPYAIVGEHWPYDGPYDPETTVAAATAIERLVRYLNNATQERSALPYAATAGSVLSGVSSAVFGLEQLTRQLAEFLERQADDPTLYDDRRDRSGAATALDAVLELEELKPAVTALAGRLQRAASIVSHLGNEDPSFDLRGEREEG